MRAEPPTHACPVLGGLSAAVLPHQLETTIRERLGHIQAAIPTWAETGPRALDELSITLWA